MQIKLYSLTMCDYSFRSKTCSEVGQRIFSCVWNRDNVSWAWIFWSSDEIVPALVRRGCWNLCAPKIYRSQFNVSMTHILTRNERILRCIKSRDSVFELWAFFWPNHLKKLCIRKPKWLFNCPLSNLWSWHLFKAEARIQTKKIILNV